MDEKDKKSYHAGKKADERKRCGQKSANSTGKGKKSRALPVLGAVVAVIAVIYLGVGVYFGSHFLFHTQINGVDVALMNVAKVKDYMSRQVEHYSLTLEESDGTREIIRGSQIGIAYVPDDELDNLVKEQGGFLWLKSLWKPSRIQAKIGVSYDADRLSDVLASLKCMDKKKQIAPQSAYPKYQNGQFEIVPEVVGSKIKKKVLREQVENAINGFQNRLELAESGCYHMPKYTEESKKVIKAAEKMNKYLGAKITYEFGKDTETVNKKKISKWLTVDKKKMQVIFREDQVKEFIQGLADKYNTKYQNKRFTTAKGDVVTVQGGSFGWLIDQEGEYEQLTKDIKSAKTVSREPDYASRGVTYGNGGVGDTYAEVDLTNQHMYFIKDGKVVLESDVVTGNPNNGNATPQGIYTLAYKSRNATLRGERKPDGSYEYETPVAYWMPFNGGIGFHDATWQSSFGGDRYKSHGSHGCVNMPKEKAAKLYDLISAGTPVVCYF